MSRWQRGEEVAARYVVQGRLAAGGMAEVYVAQMSLAHSARRRVALKRIHAHLTEDSQFVSMFVDEARLASQLNHPGVIPVLDAVEWRGDLLLVLDYVPGWDLSAVLSTARTKNIRMPLSVAVQIALGLAETLAYVHEAVDTEGHQMSIVHRDVTPSNVLIAHDGSVRLLDFGVAKAAQQATKTATGALKGKFAYMSPEQARGADVDRRSDLYALGLVLFEMLTGERAVRGKSDMGTLQAALNPEHVPVTELRPDATPELEGLVTTLVAAEPEHRHHSAEEVIRHLENVRARIGGGGALRIKEFVLKVMGAPSRPVDDGRSSLDRALALAAGIDDAPKTGTRKVENAGGEVITMPRSLLGQAMPTAAAEPTNADGGSGIVTRDSLVEADTVPATPAAALPEPVRSRNVLPLVLLGLLAAGGAVGGVIYYQGSTAGGRVTDPVADEPAPRDLAASELADPSMGFVVVTTDPQGATMYFGDEQLDGTTPAVVELPSGSVGELLLSLPGHEDTSVPIEVEAGESIRVEQALALLPGRLEVRSNPAGATVFIDGEERGVTPLVVEDMPREPVEVRVSKSGHYATVRRTARLDEDAEVLIEARLVRSEARGTLVIMSDVPNARVAVDGRVVSQGVPWRGEVSAGSRRVTVTDPASGRSRTEAVNVPANGRGQRSIRLR